MFFLDHEVEDLLIDVLAELRATKSAPTRTQVTEGKPLTLKAAAAAIGIRRLALECLIDEGKITAIPWVGGKRRVPTSEVARIQREGIPQSAAPVKPRGRKKNAGETPADVAGMLARIRAHRTPI